MYWLQRWYLKRGKEGEFSPALGGAASLDYATGGMGGGRLGL